MATATTKTVSVTYFPITGPVDMANALVAALAEAALTRGSANKATANAAGKINFICFFIFVFFRFDGVYNFTTFTLLMSGSF